MDSRDASRTLEVIRTLMERTCQYQFLTARAGLAAGTLAACGALSFTFLDAADPRHFGVVWGLVFVGSLLATLCLETTGTQEYSLDRDDVLSRLSSAYGDDVAQEVAPHLPA